MTIERDTVIARTELFGNVYAPRRPLDHEDLDILYIKIKSNFDHLHEQIAACKAEASAAASFARTVQGLAAFFGFIYLISEIGEWLF
jgi:hypothetical protein